MAEAVEFCMSEPSATAEDDNLHLLRVLDGVNMQTSRTLNEQEQLISKLMENVVPDISPENDPCATGTSIGSKAVISCSSCQTLPQHSELDVPELKKACGRLNRCNAIGMGKNAPRAEDIGHEVSIVDLFPASFAIDEGMSDAETVLKTVRKEYASLQKAYRKLEADKVAEVTRYQKTIATLEEIISVMAAKDGDRESDFEIEDSDNIGHETSLMVPAHEYRVVQQELEILQREHATLKEWSSACNCCSVRRKDTAQGSRTWIGREIGDSGNLCHAPSQDLPHSVLTRQDMADIEALKEQVRAYAEDFKAEQEAKGSLQAVVNQLVSEVEHYQVKCCHYLEQLKTYEEDFKKERDKRIALLRRQQELEAQMQTEHVAHGSSIGQRTGELRAVGRQDSPSAWGALSDSAGHAAQYSYLPWAESGSGSPAHLPTPSRRGSSQ